MKACLCVSSTNWLNLWNANPAVADPDLALDPGAAVRLGPTYAARPGDSLASVAGPAAVAMAVSRRIVGVSY